ncbi:MAG: transaldolase family protein, partial [Clostridia bacterium]|nr:transaldolase family protein [Clostridia bacterium]
REAEGLDNADINPVCTIMVGRIDDWMKHVTARDGIIIDPECMENVGVAIVKKAYKIFKEKGYTTKLLTAAYRNHHHWSAFIGGDLLMTIPYKWQKWFNASNIEVKARMEEEVPESYIRQLRQIPDFVKAYDGMAIEEFDTFGAVNKTLEQFAQGYDDLVKIIRKFMIQY